MRWLVVLVVALLALPARGARIERVPLPDVLDEAELLFEAEVRSFQRVVTNREIRGHYEVELVEDPTVRARLVYRQLHPYGRDRHGRPLVASPVATGSGLEFEARVGERYLFVVRSDEVRGLVLLRVESLDHEDEVRAQWRESLARRGATPLRLPLPAE